MCGPPAQATSCAAPPCRKSLSCSDVVPAFCCGPSNLNAGEMLPGYIIFLQREHLQEADQAREGSEPLYQPHMCDLHSFLAPPQYCCTSVNHHHMIPSFSPFRSSYALTPKCRCSMLHGENPNISFPSYSISQPHCFIHCTNFI